jgi:tetratricopeptide (TPR) repeat protein
LEFLGAAIDVDPGNAQLYTDLGKVFGTIGKHGPALQSYDQALALDARDSGAWRGRAAVSLALDRLNDALESCRRRRH